MALEHTTDAPLASIAILLQCKDEFARTNLRPTSTCEDQTIVVRKITGIRVRASRVNVRASFSIAVRFNVFSPRLRRAYRAASAFVSNAASGRRDTSPVLPLPAAQMTQRPYAHVKGARDRPPLRSPISSTCKYSPAKPHAGFSASSDGASVIAPRFEERLLLVLVGGAVGSTSATPDSVSALERGSASASVALSSEDEDTLRSRGGSVGASCLRRPASSSLCTVGRCVIRRRQ